MNMGEPAGSHRAQAEVHSNGIYAYPASSNDLDLRLDTVDRLLSMFSSDEKPVLMFSPSCEAIISALSGSYEYDRVQVSGEERYRDVPS